MASISALNSALSGLRVSQQQLNVLSTNISNVNTPGYTRKSLPLEAVSAGGVALGVEAGIITRNVDVFLQQGFWTQVSAVDALDTKATFLNRIQQFHGAPEDEISIAASLSDLRDDFAALSDSPEDVFRQRAVLDQAEDFASKVRGLSELFIEMRNDIQSEIDASVSRINGLLSQLADLNKQIKAANDLGTTSADFKDQRDNVIVSLSKEIQIDFFERSDDIMVVQTVGGTQLADQAAETLFFQSTILGPEDFYENGANGVFVGGNPIVNVNAADISQQGLQGNLGALLELRDEIIPQQQAQLDELAHKVALRFDAQGLRLFTDPAGDIPADTAPTPATPTPVTYVGFSNEFQVSAAVVADNSLIQTGTVSADETVQSGSNEVVRRIVDFAFSDVEFQQAVGTIDLRANANGEVLQDWLGIFSENQVTSTLNLSSFTDTAAIDSSTEAFAAADGDDAFEIIFDDPDIAGGPITVTVDLSTAAANFPIGGAVNNALDQIVSEINAEIVAQGVPAAFAASASANSTGRLVIESRSNIQINATGAGLMASDGLEVLGLTEGTFEATDPFIDIQVGTDPVVRVSIDPDDTDVDFLANLTFDGTDGVPGLFVNQAADGTITLRPGRDDSNGGPVFGGDLKIIGGPFVSDGTGTINGVVGAGTVVSGDTLIESLFGSASPVADSSYSSLTSTGASVNFRSSELGPGADLSTDIISATGIIDFAQKMINRQSETLRNVESQQTEEISFRDVMEQELLNESGVNLDEELAALIQVQTAFSASARVVGELDQMFDELLNSLF